jgi:hypothetical protein
MAPAEYTDELQDLAIAPVEQVGAAGENPLPAPAQVWLERG